MDFLVQKEQLRKKTASVVVKLKEGWSQFALSITATFAIMWHAWANQPVLYSLTPPTLDMSVF